MAKTEIFVTSALPATSFRETDPEALKRRFAYLDQAEHGTIGDHPYRLQSLLRDVIIAGEGWSILIPENPSAIPIVETFHREDRPCPVLEPEFLQKAVKLAKDRSIQVQAETAIDWPRRSTKPDLNGTVRHPLSGEESHEWFCLHCDGKITGAQIARNLWHCPGCGASPLDIFADPFWSDGGQAFFPVESDDGSKMSKPEFQIVDGRPKLNMNEENIALLIRCALLDDAANVSERLAALRAEINVTENNCLWISLDDDLWPEDKDPDAALSLAEKLGLEVELVSMWSTAPFAWPGLGELTSKTNEYVEMMLSAYAEHGVSVESKSNEKP